MALTALKGDGYRMALLGKATSLTVPRFLEFVRLLRSVRHVRARLEARTQTVWQAWNLTSRTVTRG